MTPTLPSAADAATALSSFQQPDSGTLLTQAQSKYGIPDLQRRVSDLRGLTSNLTGAIAAVDPSVTGRTAGTFTTEGQRSALVNRERQPVIGQLDTANKSLGLATADQDTAMGNAKDEANATKEDNQRKYNQLLQTYNISAAREAAAAAAKAEADNIARQQANDDRDYQLKRQSLASSGSGGGGGQDVDPAKSFLDYIAGQFKSAGGAGNNKITRQQQDAWANQFFTANKVSQANRAQYWNLFNQTYNRTADATKDWRFAK